MIVLSFVLNKRNAKHSVRQIEKIMNEIKYERKNQDKPEASGRFVLPPAL
jgi:hypothetical protein